MLPGQFSPFRENWVRPVKLHRTLQRGTVAPYVLGKTFKKYCTVFRALLVGKQMLVNITTDIPVCLRRAALDEKFQIVEFLRDFRDEDAVGFIYYQFRHD